MRFKIFLPYLLVMAIVTYLIRAIPLVLVKHKIKNKFFNSFLYRISSHDDPGNLYSNRKPDFCYCRTHSRCYTRLPEKKPDRGSNWSLCSGVYYRRNHKLNLNPDLPQAK